jgi:hypothetical protein
MVCVVLAACGNGHGDEPQAARRDAPSPGLARLAANTAPRWRRAIAPACR